MACRADIRALLLHLTLADGELYPVIGDKNVGGGQKSINDFCQDPAINNVIMSFLNIFDDMAASPKSI